MKTYDYFVSLNRSFNKAIALIHLPEDTMPAAKCLERLDEVVCQMSDTTNACQTEYNREVTRLVTAIADRDREIEALKAALDERDKATMAALDEALKDAAVAVAAFADAVNA